MLSAVTPVSEASLSPLLPLPPPLSPPPQAARVEATVAAARMVTRRRVDLGNCSPLCSPGSSARRGGGGGRDGGVSVAGGAGPGPPRPEPEQPQPDGPDEARGGEDHHDHQDDAVDERRELRGLGAAQPRGRADVG